MVKTLDNGKVQIGGHSMSPYVKATRGRVNDLHEIDTYYAKTKWGLQGFTKGDDSFTRETFSPFYAECLTLLKNLEGAVDKALAIEDIYKHEEQSKRQLAAVLPALTALLKYMASFVQDIRAKGALTDQLIAAALEPGLPSDGNQAIIETLRAQEIRAVFRGMTEESRKRVLADRLRNHGDVFLLQALKDDFTGALIPPTIWKHIEADYIKGVAPWLFVKKDDDAHLMHEIKIRVQLIQGLVLAIMKKASMGRLIDYPQASPWSDGRFFVENAQGFVCRLPVIPQSYPYGKIESPVWWSRHEAEFSMRAGL